MRGAQSAFRLVELEHDARTDADCLRERPARASASRIGEVAQRNQQRGALDSGLASPVPAVGRTIRT